MTAWIEFVPGTGAHLITDQVVPDRANNRCAAVHFTSPTRFERFNYTTGALLGETTISALCGITSNNDAGDRAMCLGQDGFLYLSTTTVANPKTAARISKINLSTPAEVAAVQPTLFSNTANYSSVFDFYLIPFQSSGVQYVALCQEFSASVNIEIINCATMTSVATGTYPHAGTSTQILPCCGASNAGEVFIFMTTFGSPYATCYLVKASYSGSLTMTTVATYTGGTFLSDWSTGGITNSGSMIYDFNDDTFVVWVEGEGSSTPQLPYAFKLNKTTGALVWSGINFLLTDYFTGANLQNSKLTSDKLGLIQAVNSVLLSDLSTGDPIGEQWWNQHSSAAGGTCQVWNGDNSTYLIVASEAGILNYNDVQLLPNVQITLGGDHSDQSTHTFIDPSDMSVMYVWRRNYLGNYELRKRSTVDGSVISTGTSYSSSALDALTGLVGTQFFLNSPMAGATGNDHLYVFAFNNPTDSLFNDCLIQFSRSTLAITHVFPGQALDFSNTTFIWGSNSFLAVSPDDKWVVNGGNSKINQTTPPSSSTFVACYFEVWNTTNTDHSYIDMTTVLAFGFANLPQFSASGKLWTVLQPRDPTGAIGQHKYAQSILYSLTVSGSPPALSVATSTTIPDNYYTLGTNVSFDSTFIYEWLTYHENQDALYTWSNYTDFSTNNLTQGWFRKYDIGSTTFEAVQAYSPGDIHSGADAAMSGWTNKTQFATYVAPIPGPTPALFSIFNSATNSIINYNIAAEWSGWSGNIEDNTVHINPIAGSIWAFGSDFGGQGGPAAGIIEPGSNDAMFSLPTPPTFITGFTNVQAKGRFSQPVPIPPPPNPPPPTPPNPFNCLVPVISQYSNSPIMLTILEDFCEAMDPWPLINEFFNFLWNINTAVGYGLDVWGRIVGVTRILSLPQGRFFGFAEQLGSTDPFNVSPFFGGTLSGQNFSLSDDAFRLLILVKALANITDGSTKSINTLLRILFPGAGNAYVTDNQDMTMTYTFEFPLTPIQDAIINQSGVLPRSTGVAATVHVVP